MTLLSIFNRIVELIQANSTICIITVIIFLSIIELVPLKLNPWTSLRKCLSKILGWIGKCLMQDYVSKIDSIEQKTDELAKTVDQNEIDRLRHEIRCFAGNCQRGRNYSQSDFDYIFEMNDKYHSILDRIHQTNGKTDREMRYLVELYKDKQANNTFLT